MKANQIMTRTVICASLEMSLRDAHRVMKRESVRHLPVVAGARLIGIVSDRDLLARARTGLDNTLEFDDGAIADAMTVSPITCPPEATVGRIARLMLEHRIDSIPIVDDDDRMIGLVTSTDLLELLTVPEQEAKVIPFDFSLRVEAPERLAEA
jgi:acetoin utilization protein AcuB